MKPGIAVVVMALAGWAVGSPALRAVAAPATANAPSLSLPSAALKVGAKHSKGQAMPVPPPALTSGPLPPPSLLAPVAGQSFAAAPRHGRVRFGTGGPSRPGLMPLTAETRLPFGTLIDAGHGAVVLTTAGAARGRAQVVVVTGSEFIVRQHGRNPITDLILSGGDFAACPKPHSARPAAVAARATRHHRWSRRHVVRQLWARDNHGRFSTFGMTSVATVRGTIWLTQDRCDGTLTRVFRGRVVVHDRGRRRAVTIVAGHGYLARRRG